MAIDIGMMFGFRFPENFNYPYISKSITDFWRRWHISLGSFFRDYVYIPLGGNRVKPARLFFNLFVVWMLTGIWHGANWTFMAWGIFYFVLLALEKYTKFNEKFGFFGHIYAMFFVLIGWVLFRSESIGGAINYLSMMFGFAGNPLTDGVFWRYFDGSKIVLFAGLLCSLPIFPFIKTKLKKFPKLYEVVSSISLIILFVITISVCIRSTYNPFIYFNF